MLQPLCLHASVFLITLVCILINLLPTILFFSTRLVLVDSIWSQLHSQAITIQSELSNHKQYKNVHITTSQLYLPRRAQVTK